MSHITGGLLHVLRYARRVWYASSTGITAYYEQPDLGVPGAFYVNGQRIARLVVDHEGLYWDRPGPRVQDIMRRHGVSLVTGWMCEVDVSGSDVQTAIAQSPCKGATHQCGVVVQQRGTQAAIRMGADTWSVPLVHVQRVLIEYGISPFDNWSASPATGRTIIVSIGHCRCDGSIHRLLPQIVPHIPGLQGYHCRIHSPQVLQIVPSDAPASMMLSANVVLLFSTAAPRFPPGVPVQAVVAFLRSLGCYGCLQGRAMRLGVSLAGDAEEIVLL